LAAFTYTIGDDVPAPDSLNLRVYDWSGTGAPGTLLTTIPLSAGDLTTGFHDLQLATPVALPSQNFCVGLYSEPVGDGFRILTTDVGSGYTSGTSWVMAPDCGAVSFTELGVLGFGNWCVTATIDDAINLEVEATPVPTMSHWGLLLLAGLLALVTVFNFGRRFQ